MNRITTWARLARMYHRCGIQPLTAARRAARFVWRNY